MSYICARLSAMINRIKKKWMFSPIAPPVIVFPSLHRSLSHQQNITESCWKICTSIYHNLLNHDVKVLHICPRFLTFPKLSMISHAQLWLLLFLQISLFIYFNLGHGPIRAKSNVNKQTNLKNNNNQSWAWLIMLNFGNVKNLGH